VVDILIDADTIRSPELRHEIPVAVMDPFLYGEHDGEAFALVSPLDAEMIAAARPDLRRLDVFADLGLRELIASGRPRHEALLEIRIRACRELGVERAAVPPAFPLETAEALRAAGIELSVDRELFEARLRRKSDAELAGIRRATRAAEAGLAAAAGALRSAAAHNGVLRLGGEPLTCERLAALVRGAVEGPEVALGEFTVANGPAAASGHGSGSGPIAPGETVIIDLWPHDRATACFTDIARTFVAGEPDPEIVRWHELVLEAMATAVASVRPGVTGRELWEQACDHFEGHGFHTQRKPGEVTMDGFPTALGHGVGLDVHEEPTLGRSGGALVAGDVISIEPYLCRAGFGAVQVEDILLVTEDGAEVLSSFAQELQ
jgi:Xaa-Pro aminopeptidase